MLENSAANQLPPHTRSASAGASFASAQGMGTFFSLVLACAMLQGCYEQASNQTPSVALSGSVDVPRSEWKRFVAALERELRIVPDVRGGQLVAIRVFCMRLRDTKRCAQTSSMGRLGLESGDRIVAVNGTRVSKTSEDADTFLRQQFQRSQQSGMVSFAIESDGKERTVAGKRR